MISKIGYSIICICIFALIGFSQGVDAGVSNKEQKSVPGKTTQKSSFKIIGVKVKKGLRAIPQIAKPRTPQEQKFNALVRKYITRDYSGYDVSYSTPEFVSVYLYDETCGASCHTGITPVNFDLKSGNSLENLAELFRPRSDFLRTTASYCIRELKRTWDCVDDGEWFNNGSSPTVENYSVWRVSRKGLEITFPQYQLGAGACGGTSVVVPYSILRGMFRQDVEWLHKL